MGVRPREQPPSEAMYCLRPIARALPQRLATRTFAASAFQRAGGGPPKMIPEGAPEGTVPTEMNQATGLERFELLSKLNGEDPFFMAPLQVEHMGTKANPITVKSLDHDRIIGCTGFPVDSHDTIYFPVHKDNPMRCPECGCAYAIDFVGPEPSHHH